MFEAWRLGTLYSDGSSLTPEDPPVGQLSPREGRWPGNERASQHVQWETQSCLPRLGSWASVGPLRASASVFLLPLIFPLGRPGQPLSPSTSPAVHPEASLWSTPAFTPKSSSSLTSSGQAPPPLQPCTFPTNLPVCTHLKWPAFPIFLMHRLPSSFKTKLKLCNSGCCLPPHPLASPRSLTHTAQARAPEFKPWHCCLPSPVTSEPQRPDLYDGAGVPVRSRYEDGLQ